MSGRGYPSHTAYIDAHPGARAGTVHEGGQSTPVPPAQAPFQIGRFQVVHDPNQHRPLGIYRVLIGARVIGQQLSYPGADDCERLLRIADEATAAPYAPTVVQANVLGAGTPAYRHLPGDWNHSLSASRRGGHSKAKGLRMKRRAA